MVGEEWRSFVTWLEHPSCRAGAGAHSSKSAEFDEALQSDQGRKYVYLVNDNKEVVYRGGEDLELGHSIEGLRVVKKGLSETDRVIIAGMQRVRPKQAVDVKMQPPPKKPYSPLTQLSRNDGE